MSEAHTRVQVEFVNWWPDVVREKLRLEHADLAIRDGPQGPPNRLVPLAEITSLLSALSALLTIGKTLWSSRTKAAEVSTASPVDPSQLNRQLQANGNFATKVAAAHITGQQPFQLQITLLKPQETGTRIFSLTIGEDQIRVEQLPVPGSQGSVGPAG